MTEDDLTDAEQSRMAGNLIRMGKKQRDVSVETRRSRLPAGPKKPPRIEIAPVKVDGEHCWRFFLVGNGHRVALGEEFELATVQAKARTLETMGMKVEWVRA